MAQQASTYRAVHAVSPGKLELVHKPLVKPPSGHVRITWRPVAWPLGLCDRGGSLTDRVAGVPGHEANQRIDAVGEAVVGWSVGQRVGVGFLGGNCGYCEYCRDGDLVNCKNQSYTGVQQDGGYAESMIAKASSLISVPDDLPSVDAAPLLLCRPATFSALRNSPARAGGWSPFSASTASVTSVCNTLATWDLRWLGSIAAPATEPNSRRSSAHTTMSTSTASDVAKRAAGAWGATVVLATASGGKAVAAAVNGLRRGGVVISLGATDEPIELSAFALLFQSLGVVGALTGTPAAGDAALRFSTITDVAAMVETMPLEKAADAYAKMMAGQARFRMVLTMG